MNVSANLSLWSNLCKSLLLCTGLIVLSLPAAAQSTATRALQEIENKNWERAFNLASQSNNATLMKLYFWQYYQTDENNGDFERIAHFIRNNPDWPKIDNIRRQLERRITPLESDTDIIKWFKDYPPLTAKGVDHYAKALLRQGLENEFRRFIGEWWATTDMSRDEQKQIYTQYKAYIPLHAHSRLFDKLLFNDQYTNARAIAAVLGSGYSELAEARIALAEEKPEVNGLISRVPAALRNDPGLLYERLKWRRKNDLNQEAIEILHNEPAANKIANPDDWWKERHIIIRRMMEEGYYRQAYTLASGHKQTEGFSYAEAEWLAGWLALRFMDKPAEAYQRFEALHAKVTSPVSLARAAYWAGRAAEAMNVPDLSKTWYERAAQYQTVFYGQKAGEKIGLHNALQNAKPPSITPDIKARLDASPFYQASMLYSQAGMKNRAIEFLRNFVQAEESAEAYYYAVLAAADIGSYRDVIMLAKEATKNGYFLTLQSYPNIMNKLSKAHQSVEPAFIHSLIRQESQFDQHALSPAGALGLMQLMPATAQEVAGKVGVSHQTQWLTSVPEHNIQLGSYYMARLLDRYNGEYIMAIAAYNAGPGRVDNWIKTFGDPRTGEVDPMDWGELIPIYETRNYIQRVMEGLYVYRLLLKEKSS
jgi:soluble lytic murein transglycosylase